MIGATYIFMLQAYNINGVTSSDTAAFVLASVPATPSDIPYSNLSYSSSEQVMIVYNGISDDGGSPVLSYSLEISTGPGGPFIAVYGASVDTMVLSYLYRDVTKGMTYRVRYRARNVIGWSDYSPIGFVLAASIPEQPK
jgi:hypothetical protein